MSEELQRFVEKRALSLKEASYRIGVSKPRIYQLIAEKEIPSFHIGRKHFVLSTDLDSFIEQQKRIEV